MIAAALALVLAAPLTLGEVRAGARQNLDALKAEIELQKAAQGVVVARSSILPQLQLGAGLGAYVNGPQRVFSTVPALDANGQVVYQQSSVEVPGSSRGNFSLSLSVSQLIYDGGRWWNQIAQAGAQQEAAQGQLDEQRLASEYEAVRRFYELLKAQVSQDVLAASLQRSQSQVERAKSLYEAARGTRLDALDAEINVGNDRISLLRQRQAITSSQVDLLKWLGRPSAEVEAVDPGAVEHLRAVLSADAALERARGQRPLLKALARQVTVAERGVDLAWSAFMPHLGASAAYVRQGPSADPFFTDLTQQNSLNAGLSLQWDLFSGLQTKGQVAQAESAVRTAKVSLAQAQAELEGDVRRSLDALQVQLQISQISSANLQLARAALALAEERFNAGAGSTLEVRDAQVKLTTAQLNEVSARVDVEVARAGLYRVIGGDAEGAP